MSQWSLGLFIALTLFDDESCPLNTGFLDLELIPTLCSFKNVFGADALAAFENRRFGGEVSLAVKVHQNRNLPFCKKPDWVPEVFPQTKAPRKRGL